MEGLKLASELDNPNETSKRQKSVPMTGKQLFKKLETSYSTKLATMRTKIMGPEETLCGSELEHVREVSFDPTAAVNFGLFQCDPETRVDSRHYQPTNFSLNNEEMAFFKSNGFVVQPRLGGSSMGRHYYNLYSNDMPVFVTADAMLHAWHWSFDRLFGVAEESFALAELQGILRKMHGSLSGIEKRTPVFSQEVMEKIDTYLTVASNLSNFEPQFTHQYAGGKYAQVANPRYVEITVALPGTDMAAVNNLVSCATNAVGGSFTGALFWRSIDWNDFKPAGRYEKSQRLRAYYRTVKWISQPIQIASRNLSETIDNFKAALLLIHLARVSAATESSLPKLQNVLQSLAGPSDGFTLLDLNSFLVESGYAGDLFETFDSEAKASQLQQLFVSAPSSAELINSSTEVSNKNEDSNRYVFSVLSPSLCIDHWVLSKLTAASPRRRTVSLVDVAYSVLNNTDAGRIISNRIVLPVNVTPKPVEKPFNGYAENPHVIPEDQRGDVIAEFTFVCGYTDPISVTLPIRENDTVATLKNLLWPLSSGVKKNVLPLTPITISVADHKVGEIYWLDENMNSKKFSDCVPLKKILAAADWKFQFSNLFPFTKPATAPKILGTHEYIVLRDGHPVHYELSTARDTLNELPPEAWNHSVYSDWLNTLRALSPSSLPKEDREKLPEAMRTLHWARRTLNSQLASWTELQHDFVLYTKKVVMRGGCDYPDGLVELNPNMWKTFRKMVVNFRKVMENLEVEWENDPILYLKHFEQTLLSLEDISTRQLNDLELTKKQRHFLKEMLETLEYGSGPMKFEGWYPRLYWPSPAGCVDVDDGLTCQVYQHMADPQTGDKGSILHGATNRIDHVMVAVERDGVLRCYAGGLFQFYEFESESRFCDTDWQRMPAKELPERPEWATYLI